MDTSSTARQDELRHRSGPVAPEAGGAELPTGPGTKQDRAFGAIAGLMILTAIILLVNSLVGSSPVSESAPDLQLVAPADGDSVSLPIEIRFRSSEALSNQPGGWGARNFHLHVEVGGVELMPGPTDIRPASANEYIWTVASLPLGDATLRLFWADAAHRPVTDGASNAANVVVR